MTGTIAHKFEKKLQVVKKSMEEDKDRFITDNVFILALNKLVEYQLTCQRLDMPFNSLFVVMTLQSLLNDIKAKHLSDAHHHSDSMCDVHKLISRMYELLMVNHAKSSELNIDRMIEKSTKTHALYSVTNKNQSSYKEGL